MLDLNKNIANRYNSASQRARVLTEDWVQRNIFCPNCGNSAVAHYPNNRPVADFFCPKCNEDYELKSRGGGVGRKIVDGAYKTMIERLNANNNPNLFIMNYDLSTYSVKNFMVVPKHFFIPEIIEKRKPLAQTARRAGWVGCNILLSNIPESGKVFFVRNGVLESRDKILREWQKTLFLREEKEISARGWLLDVMRCIEKLDKKEFVLNDIYDFEKELAVLHPENKHVKDKIRQQLQILRDKGYLEFVSRGEYRLI